MRPLSDTLARLKQFAGAAPQGLPSASPLKPFASFGSNPGQLLGWIHVPEIVRKGAPLVVVLHGCTQNARGYDDSAGWTRLADRHGFVVLFPEQQRSNNPNLCFNWFTPEDTARGGGEALSIRQMVAAAQIAHGTDPARVFVTGLSAGGAMTAVMLATYPDVFAGGAVIAGLPFAVARSVPEAFDRMRGHGGPRRSELAGLVRAASQHSGGWPTLSVWHGDADLTVAPSNAAALVEQWRPLHEASGPPVQSQIAEGCSRRVWKDAAGREVIEHYSLADLGHGTPLDAARSDHREKAAPFMLDAGVSSTALISRYWGIVTDRPAGKVAQPAEPPAPPHAPAWGAQSAIAHTINDALRTAGLMK